MRIIETNLAFREGLRKRSSTKRVVSHHSDTPGDVSAQTIHLWHLAKTNPVWAGIGYHFVIRLDGKIERCRPIEMIGSHAGATGNPDSIGVCWAGRFILSGPTQAQIEAYVWLHKYLEQYYGHELEVNKHNDFMATACPGEQFPIDLIRTLVKGGADMAEQWQADLVQYLVDQGLIEKPREPEEKVSWWELGAIIKRMKGDA